jgi:hypothetical protein
MIPLPNSTLIIPDMYIIITVFIFCILSITSSSIGIEAYNKNDSLKKTRMGNFSFLIINLIISIILLILSGYAIVKQLFI